MPGAPVESRREDVNMSSVWECSRNDIVSNFALFAAAALVWATDSGWPDLVIGLALAALLLRSAVRVIRHAIAELRPHQQHRGVPA